MFQHRRETHRQHRVESDDDAKAGGHATDQNDADHLSLLCGKQFATSGRFYKSCTIVIYDRNHRMIIGQVL